MGKFVVRDNILNGFLTKKGLIWTGKILDGTTIRKLKSDDFENQTEFLLFMYNQFNGMQNVEKFEITSEQLIYKEKHGSTEIVHNFSDEWSRYIAKYYLGNVVTHITNPKKKQVEEDLSLEME